MKAKLINKYNTTSKFTGASIRMYVYEIYSYTAEELADYQTTLGPDRYVQNDDGTPLLFTSVFEGNNVDVVKAKTYDENSNLVDTYRAISSEDFELKRSMLVAQQQASDAPARVRPNRRAVKDANDAAF